MLNLRERELISLVGGGGKSTLLFALGDELAAAGKRVILTTTTKMGRDQADSAATVCWSADTDCAIAAMDQRSPVMLITEGDDHKVTGPQPELVDRLFAESDADYVIVEADGSRGKPLKAPAMHEPVVPDTTTLLLALVGVDAVGKPMATVTHRVEEARRIAGLEDGHVLTPGDCAAILLHPEGVLRKRPAGSRAIVAVTKAVTAADRTTAESVCAAVAARRPDVGTIVLSLSR